MKKTLYFLFALSLLTAQNAHAEDKSFLQKAIDFSETAINNARKNLSRSAKDMSNDAKETRKMWGQDNNYDDTYEKEGMIIPEQRSYYKPENYEPKNYEAESYKPENYDTENYDPSIYETAKDGPENLVPEDIDEYDSYQYKQLNYQENTGVTVDKNLPEGFEEVEIKPISETREVIE